MESKYSQEQLNEIMEQGMVLQCACPSLLARLLSDATYLNEYQAKCLRDNPTDQRVHEAIARATHISAKALEDCLTEVLVLENWEISRDGTIKMPESLIKQQMRLIA